MNLSGKKDFLIKTAYFFTVIAIIFAVYKFLIGYFFPFAIGLILACALQKPSEKLSKLLKIKRGKIAAVTVVISFILLALLLGFCVFLIVSKLTASANYISSFFETLEKFLTDFSQKLPKPVADFFSNKGGFDSSVSKIAADMLTSVSGKAAAEVPALLIGSVITVVASFYIARDFDYIKEYIFSFLSDEKIKLVEKSIDIVFKNVFKLIKGYFLLSLITFAILLSGFLIIGFKNAVYIAAIISLVDFLPVLGTGTVLIPWSIGEFVFGNYTEGVSIALLYLTDAAVRNFAEPKIVGKQLGIPPIVLLIFIFIGIKVFGFLGMILAVLSLVVIVELYRQEIITL